MLQPLQLKDVSVRYSHEIAELREFLAKSGLTLDTPETLRSVTTRLQEDRAFRRDLTSHAWVVIHAGERPVRHADLLAMVAIAAAGPRFAAEAADKEAHDLLRFVMQVWNSFDASPRTLPLPAHVPAAPAVVSPAQPYRAAQDVAPVSFTRNVYPEPEASLSLSMPEENEGRRRVLWIGAVAGVLAVSLAGLLLHHNSATDAKAPAAPTTQVAPATSGTAVLANQDQGSLSKRQDASGSTPARTGALSTPYSQLAESSSDLPGVGAPVHAKPSPGIPMPVAHSSVSRSSVSRPSASAYRPLTVPSSRASRYAPPAKPNSAPSVDSAYVPRVVPVDNLRLRGGPASAGTVRQAIVRPTSLGIMAANVTYSPAPMYPTAAASARVQGEVKLEAEVGRDGTVASTRIISGPPLLADAAADAVQHWRYRPYLYEGKPIAMNAQIVMDFQLP